MRKTAAQKRVSKAEWLLAGLQALERGGLTAVRIGLLAKELKISRSGFYWHFEDRRDLLKQMLHYWRDEYTDVVVRNVSIRGGTPESRLRAIHEMVVKYDLHRYEFAIRDWAKYDPEARETVAHVNKIRLDFVRSIFSQLGLEGDELEMRAMLFVCYESMELPMFFEAPASKLKKLLKLRLNLLTKT